MRRVKQRVRPYDGSRRRLEAQRSYDSILDAARVAFETAGYATATVAGIARDAGVSVETIYKRFGGKPGLVRAIYERGLAGRRDAVPAPHRSDAMSDREADPQSIVQQWGALAAEVSPLVAPILLLVRSAAATEPSLAAVIADANAQRLSRMRHNANKLARRGFLRTGVTATVAADVMWALVAPELYELLVVRRGWTPAKFGRFIGDVMAATLVVANRDRGVSPRRRRSRLRSGS
jgi:AcrR family transcriptional regulator